MFRLLAKYHKTGSVYWQIYHKSEYKQIIKKSKLETQKSDPHLKIAFIFRRVTSGTRTHDIQNHNLTL